MQDDQDRLLAASFGNVAQHNLIFNYALDCYLEDSGLDPRTKYTDLSIEAQSAIATRAAAHMRGSH